MIIPVIVLQIPERTVTERGSHGSLFPYKEKLQWTNKRKSKPFMTCEQLPHKLKDEKKLGISDNDYAIKLLKEPPVFFSLQGSNRVQLFVRTPLSRLMSILIIVNHTFNYFSIVGKHIILNVCIPYWHYRVPYYKYNR